MQRVPTKWRERTKQRRAPPAPCGRWRGSRAARPPSTRLPRTYNRISMSTRVADPVDRSVVIVGDQQGAILHHHHVHGTAEVAVVLHHAGQEGRELRDLAVAIEGGDRGVGG